MPDVATPANVSSERIEDRGALDPARDLFARLESAVLAQLPSALERIQNDMQEIGAAVFDVRPLEPSIRAFLQARYEQLATPATGPAGDRVCLEFGRDDASSPAPLARAVSLFAVRQIVERWERDLEQLERAEARKLATWGRRVLGDRRLVLNQQRLTLEEALPVPEEVVTCLGLVRQALLADRQTLRRMGNTEVANDAGHFAFLRDFARALTSDERMEQLLRDLWDVRSASDIDAVLAHAEVRGSAHEKPLRYYADLLKDLLALPDAERRRVIAAVEAV